MRRYTPREYLLIDMANQYGNGIDKKTFPQRIAWAKSIKRPMSKVGFAKKPYQYTAAVVALEKADKGEAIGHLVGLDASASGISLMGALMGCETTARNCGIIGNKPSDVYTVLTDTMQEITEEEVPVEREDSKLSLMTRFYGSAATPKMIFGDGDMLDTFYEAGYEVAPGANELLEILLASWQPYAPEHSWRMVDGFMIKIPVLQKVQSKIEIDELEGHPAIQYIHYVNEGTAQGLSIAANGIHSIDGFIVREMTRRCNYDKEELLTVKDMLSKSLASPRNNQRTTVPMYEKLFWKHGFASLACSSTMLASGINGYSDTFKVIMLELINDVLEYESFEMLQIHDEFKCHPNHVNRMREVYIGILAEIADSDMAQELVRQIRNDDTFVLEKLSEGLGDLIRKGEYPIS